MIRQATLDDIPDIMVMAVAFYEKAELPFEFVHADMASHLAWLISEGGVFRGEDSAIGGVLQSMPFNSNVKLLNQFFWWSPTGEGVRLLRAYEKYAREAGAVWLVMNILTSVGERAVKILKHRGYQARDTGHVKVL